MSDKRERFDRFDRATSRLMQAHQHALETCEGALDVPEAPTPPDTPEAFMPLGTFATATRGGVPSGSEEGRLYRAALEDVRAILVGASEDVRAILGEGDEGGG